MTSISSSRDLMRWLAGCHVLAVELATMQGLASRVA